MSQMPINTVLTGDCTVVLRDFPDASVDLIVTDAPYGLEFMGKDWDKAVPRIETWKESLRVLKPGAFAFILCTPRQDCLSHMIVNLESAGFDCGYSSLYWTYASGLPKGTNIALGVDKRECRRQLAEKLGRSPTKEEFKEAWKTFREVVGHYMIPSDSEAGNAGKEYSDMPIEGNVYADPHRDTRCATISLPTSPEAKALDGSYGGFQPKPAVEVILVAMKPLSERTYVDQALKNKKGVTWLDDGRIPFHSQDDAETTFDNSTAYRAKEDWVKGKDALYQGGFGTLKGQFSKNGRFPANLLVSDDALNDGKDWSKGGDIPNPLPHDNAVYGKHTIRPPFQSYGDSGTFSRYFDLDAWFEKQLAALPESARQTFPFLVVPKASRGEREEGLDLPKQRKYYDDGRGNSHDIFSGRTGDVAWKAKNPANPTRNPHPTVKPLELMSYLITLGSREGDVVLDPFAGSGTTLIAAHILNRKWIGIEIETEYAKIAQARLKPYLSQEKLP